MRDSLKKVTIEIPRVISKLDFLRDAIVDFLKENNISEGTSSRIELSVYEAVVNIIEHGSNECDEKAIIAECAIDQDEIVIMISYYGEKFDITQAELPDIEKHYKAGKMRGLGIYFIMTLMDDVTYHHDKMKNILTMKKKL